MVLPASDRYPPTFVVCDPKGTPLGKVRNPVGRRVVGLGEGTVYLDRPIRRFLLAPAGTGFGSAVIRAGSESRPNPRLLHLHS
jgi:hypothetical protein